MQAQQSIANGSPEMLSYSRPDGRNGRQPGIVLAWLAFGFATLGGIAAGFCVGEWVQMQQVGDALWAGILLISSWSLCGCALLLAVVAMVRSAGKRGWVGLALALTIPTIVILLLWLLPAHKLQPIPL
jgi:hypothetical protein